MISDIIEDHSELIVGVEKLATREFIGVNNTLESDASGTDIWFYVIDPETETILPRNHSLVKKSIFDKSSMDNITFDITGQIQNTAFNIHEPLILQKSTLHQLHHSMEKCFLML